MCLSPKWIYKKGRYKSDNYRGTEGSPYELGTYSKCGSCEVCIAERCNNWVIRNYYEAKAHSEKCFITLTYEENPFFVVRKDIQDFLKRFRAKLEYKFEKTFKKSIDDYIEGKIKTAKEFWEIVGNEPKIRIFYSGEYGSLRGRSHWHIIVYGWEDKNIKYLGINKRGNIMYQSKIVNEAWGLGRTSYQKFDDNEIPYTALYTTAQEEFKKAYKLTREKAMQIKRIAKNNLRMKKAQRDNLLKELNEYLNQMEKEKEKYIAIKECQGWSQALGWEEFLKEYMKHNKYCWEEYISGNTFCTPSPWVKKLANMGSVDAAQEMFKREEMIIQSQSTEEEKAKNYMKVGLRRKKEVIEWNEEKTKVAGEF